MRDTDRTMTLAQAREVTRVRQTWNIPESSRRLVTDKERTSISILAKGGFGTLDVRLGPGQTQCIETPGGTLVEVHRLGAHVTWTRPVTPRRKDRSSPRDPIAVETRRR